MQIGVLEPQGFSKKAISELKRIGRVLLFSSGSLNEFIADKNILFIRLNFFIDKNFLKNARNLKCICTPTTGLNHIDLNECEKRQIKIISLKGEYEFLSTIRATPEHTFGLVLSLLRNYKKAFITHHNPIWDRDLYKGYELYENTVGIIGFGRVGKILAKYFEAFGTKVYFYDKVKSIEAVNNAIKCDSVEEVVRLSNIVILSASYTRNNDIIFCKQEIDLLKGKYFINTSRGELIDERYLITKINEEYFKGVALDVIQNEQSNNNLLKLIELTKTSNLLLTSHISGATFSSMHKTECFIVEKLYKEYIQIHLKK